MVLIFILASAAVWLLPMLLSLCVVYDGRALRVTERRFAVTVLADLLLEWMLWFRAAGPLGPISMVRALVRRTVSYQALLRWALLAVLAMALAAAVGFAVRNVRIRRGKAVLRRARLSSRGIRRVLLLFAVSTLGAALVVGFSADGARKLSLQEVCRRQRGVDADESYVVVKNTGAWPNAPAELFLTTDPDTPRAYRAAPLSIAPGETAQITERAEAFVDISRSGGDTLFLMDGFGNVLDAVELPETPADTVYRRADADWVLCSLTDAEASVAAPIFSAAGGFYDAPFDLTLRAEAGQRIYYTLDGSDPDTDDTEYSGPIRVYDRSAEPNRYRSIRNVQPDYLDKAPIGVEPVDKAFVVRAVAVDESGVRGAVATQTYFIDQNAYADSLVISLTADPDALFGPDGIYVTGAAYDEWYLANRDAGEATDEDAPTPNYLLRGAASERAAYLEAYENGAPLFAQPVGIRIQGNTSRSAVLKRFSVYSRAVYGADGLFAASPFSGRNAHAIVLRQGLDNAVSHAAAEGRDVAVLQIRPAHVFLDGEFWYDTFVQEKYCRAYFAQAFHVAKQNVEYIEIGAWSNVPQEDRKAVESLERFAEENDLAQPEPYAALCGQIDVQSLIDYLCIQAYLGNADTTAHANYCIWRTKLDEHSAYGDGRWRWALNDMDLRRDANRKAAGVETDAEVDPFTATRSEDWPSLFQDNPLYLGLKENPTFRAQFVRSFMDIANTTFARARMEQVLARFGLDMGYDKGFFENRTAYMIRFLAREFALEGTAETLTLQTDTPEAGTVKLNTFTPDLSGGAWSGQYFTDVPVSLTAVPAPGHSFDHWEVDGQRMESSEIELYLQEGGTMVHAVFR